MTAKKKTTKKKTAKKTSRPKQGVIPGAERKRHPDIEAAAETYVEHRDIRVAATQDEVKSKQHLMAMMKKHDETMYDYEDEDGEPKRIELVEVSESVKVRKRKIAADEAAE